MIDHTHPDYYRLHLDQTQSRGANTAYHAVMDTYLTALENDDETTAKSTGAQVNACIQADVIKIDTGPSEYERWLSRHPEYCRQCGRKECSH